MGFFTSDVHRRVMTGVHEAESLSTVITGKSIAQQEVRRMRKDNSKILFEVRKFEHE